MIRAWAAVLVWAATTIQCAAIDVTAIWDAVSDPRVGGYDLYYGTASRTYTTTLSTTSTSVEVHALEEGVVYYFAVKACKEDRSECSEFSDEISYIYARVPTNLRITGVGIVNSVRAEVRFGWNIADPVGVTYALCVVLTTESCQWATPTATADVNFKSLVLVPNKKYKATVRAVMNGVLSQQSNTIVFNTKRVTIKK